MKTNKIMRIASLILVAVMLSTCAISGTFAKYTTHGSGTDTARVAKWGVEVTATNAAFADAYKNEMVEWVATETTVNTDITVKSEEEDVKVIAPGTEGGFAVFSITGTPEVDVEITYTATATITGNWEGKDGQFYFPLIVKNNGEAIFTGTQYTSAETAKANLEKAITGLTAKYNSNTNLDTAATAADITWEWPFTTEGNDANDTMLGNIAAGKVANKTAPSLTIAIGATVTQID